jgi:hypothetical protein
MKRYIQDMNIITKKRLVYRTLIPIGRNRQIGRIGHFTRAGERPQCRRKNEYPAVDHASDGVDVIDRIDHTDRTGTFYELCGLLVRFVVSV